jgi:hypothetical protein
VFAKYNGTSTPPTTERSVTGNTSKDTSPNATFTAYRNTIRVPATVAGHANDTTDPATVNDVAGPETCDQETVPLESPPEPVNDTAAPGSKFTCDAGTVTDEPPTVPDAKPMSDPDCTPGFDNEPVANPMGEPLLVLVGNAPNTDVVASAVLAQIG